MKSKNKNQGNKLTREQLSWRCSVVPDPPDARDWIAEAEHPSVALKQKALPAKIDYADQTPLVEHQGEYGSCVGWATVRGLREWMYQKSTGNNTRLSVRFVWMAAKETDQFEINTFVANAGTSLKTAFKILLKYGVPEEKYYPYHKDLISFSTLRDKRDFFFNAAKYRISNYYQLASNKIRKAHLVNIGPFVATLPVDESWSEVGSDGIIVDSGRTEDAAIGGHAVLVVGYNDQTKMFKFKNSWGQAWGELGFGYFSYNFAEDQLWTAMGTDLVSEII